MCARSGCLRRRAINQLTGQLHDHCSIDCMRQDQATEAVSNTAEENGTATACFVDVKYICFNSMLSSQIWSLLQWQMVCSLCNTGSDHMDEVAWWCSGWDV